MDISKTAVKVLPKQQNMDNLTKDDLVHKAKAVMNSQQAEVDNLKSKEVPYAVQIIESEKSPDVISTLDAMRANKTPLVVNNPPLKLELINANKDNSDMEIEIVGLRRQLARMLDENRQLSTHVDEFKKHEVCLNEIGLEQRQQLLYLEQSTFNQDLQLNLNENLKKVHDMLTEGLDEIIKLKYENSSLIHEFEHFIDSIAIERTNDFKLKQYVQHSQVITYNLESQLIYIRDALNNLKLCPKVDVQRKVTELEDILIQNNDEFAPKEFESTAIIAIDFKTDVSKNKTVVEPPGNEIRSTNSNLFNSLIVSNLESEYQKLQERNKSFHAKIIKFSSEINKLRMDKENVVVAFKSYNNNVKVWKEKLEKLSYFLCIETIKRNATIKEQEILNEKYSTQNAKFNLLNEELEEKTKDLEIFREEVDNLKHTISELSEKNAILVHRLELSKKIESELTSKSIEKINTIFSETGKLEGIIGDHKKKDLSESITLGEITELTFNECNKPKGENVEVLNELNIISRLLREREESLFQHQTENKNLLGKLEKNEADINKFLCTISEKDEIILTLQDRTANTTLEGGMVKNELISQKNMEIRALQNELIHLKDLMKEDINRENVESDAHSTSTISRSEDLGRFKDLDTTWEDRYSKLRSLALKQKARIRDLTTQLGNADSNINNLNLKLCNNMRLTQTVNGQCDSFQQDLNKATEESAQYFVKQEGIAHEIILDKNELATKDDIINGLQIQVKQMEKDKTKIELWKKQVSIKVQSLKSELEAKEVLKRDFEIKVSDLNIQLDQKDQKLFEEIKQHLETKNNLQDCINECKKQSVLNLEMQDYERSGKELNQRLEKRLEVCNNLQHQVNGLNETSNSQREQIQTLEAQLMKVDNQVDAGRREISNIQKKCTSLETMLNEKEISILDLTGSLEEAKRENEDLNVQLSKVITGQLKLLDSVRSEQDAFQLQVLGFERRIAELHETMNLKDLELSCVKSEYNDYKLRAQSVLRQNHSRDIGTEEKLSEEADSLRSAMSIIQIECEELRYSLDEFKISNDNLVKQKLVLDDKLIDMQYTMDMEKKKYIILSEQYDSVIKEHSENTKILQAQYDAVANCYRSELSKLGSQYSEEMRQLQAELDQCNVCHSNSTVEKSPPSYAQITYPQVTREAAEGSESEININTISGTMTGLPDGSSQHALEKLLDVEVGDVDIPALRRQLMDQESRVTHLADLLADTEQDLAKHAQMNLMLKEEIRRQQRSFEREQHAENLEYMKNVIVKFITLSSGDERQRMVPVLNTILRLSPEETQKLNTIAKGDNQGWYNYIPAWNKFQ